jgi:t-SNARE complex subunit (syntaxin)
VRGEFELSLQASGEEAQQLERFFAGVDALKEAMRRVKATNKRLHDLHERAFDDETSAEEAHELREAKLVAKNEALFEAVRERTLDLKDVPLTGDSFRKLKHNILNGTNMKSAKLLLDFKGVLKDHNQRLKEDTWRQLKEQRLDDKGNTLDDDDDDDAFHDAHTFDPNTEQVGDFMQKFVFREKASSAKKYLEEKQRDLEVIEKNMMELNELMKDFAVMVESANEPLDQIDAYIRGTKANMVMVEENLRQAKYKVLGMRKKKLFTALGVAVVVIVVVAVVVGLVCLL